MTPTPDLTDDELIAAIGWQPCKWHKFDGRWWWCSEHGIAAWATSPEVCSAMSDRLVLIRVGIDLAHRRNRRTGANDE